MNEQLETTTIVPATVDASVSHVTAMNYMYPGLDLPEDAPPQVIERIFLTTQEYTATEYLPKDRFVSSSVLLPDGNKQKFETPLLIAGVMLQRIILSTGEEKIRTIFKIEMPDGSYEYTFFVADVLARDVIKFLSLKIRPMGDWDTPMWAYITRFALPTGHSYRLRFFQPKPTQEG